MTDDSGVNQRLCSVFSKANGEDPGGTAPSWQRALLVEVRKPWDSEVQETRHFPSVVSEALRRAEESGVACELLCITPDSEYSVDDHVRVLYFQRPEGPFATFDKDDYLVPNERLGPLVDALLMDRRRLGDFEPDLQDTSAVREILVCSHGSHDTCCATFGFPIYDVLRNRYAAQSGGSLRVWQMSHLGGHRFAPNIVDLPEGRNWVNLSHEDLDALVLRNRPPSELRDHYRGWLGLDTLYEQIVERELFIREGWAWTDRAVGGRVLSFDEDRQQAEVRIDVASSDGEASAAYQAEVKQTGTVPRVGCPGGEPSGEAAQFTVGRLVEAG